jgi:hypothetical protein
MNVSIKASEDLTVFIGQRIPGEFVFCDKVHNDSYVLGKATDNKEGHRAIITGVSYLINKKHYYLQGWGIEAIITDSGVVSPLLRRAEGQEQNILQKVIREPRKTTRYEGDKNPWWPNLVSLCSLQTNNIEEFTEVVLEEVEKLEDLGVEIDESLSFGESIEEIED